MRIYVAGPYSAGLTLDQSARQWNTDIAMQVGAKLLAKGHNPYVPHWTHYLDQACAAQGTNVSWSHWLKLDYEWLDRCRALFYIGPSAGADAELARAKHQGLDIFTSLDDVPYASGYLKAVGALS